MKAEIYESYESEGGGRFFAPVQIDSYKHGEILKWIYLIAEEHCLNFQEMSLYGWPCHRWKKFLM